MLEQHQRAGGRSAVVLVAPAPSRTARPVTPPADGHRPSHQRVQLAPELKLYEPVKVVHLY